MRHAYQSIMVVKQIAHNNLIKQKVELFVLFVNVLHRGILTVIAKIKCQTIFICVVKYCILKLELVVSKDTK